MITLGPLGFAAPWVLIGFIALPLLWMLLRASPPAPNTVVFAPLRLLQGLAKTPETPDSTPWWLIVLRLVMAALIILALARPILRPVDAEYSSDPLLVMVDDGWAAAAQWAQMRETARNQLEAARADGRTTALIFTAGPHDRASPIQFEPASSNLARLDAHAPMPWSPQYAGVAEHLSESLGSPGFANRFDTLWISNGLSNPGDRDLAELLSGRGAFRILLPAREDTALGLIEVEADADGFTAVIARSDDRNARSVSVTALSADGRAIARAEGQFSAGETEVRLDARLPLDLRNRISRVQIDGVQSAGAVHLTGDRWRRPRVGLVTPASSLGQPLLSDTHYAREALSIQAEVITGDLETVAGSEPAALVLVDAIPTSDERIASFLESGGLVIRFAGPRLASNPDELLPIPLRQGGRLFGSALAWDEAQRLAPFPDDSPFAGLPVPEEATVQRQVLAEPGPALNARVWARLEDGTPLVTADRRGEGWLVLFHVTAGPAWSSLPLSGVFPSMLERTLGMANSRSVSTPSSGAWRIETALNGSGIAVEPGANTQTLAAQDFLAAEAGPGTPPGVWSLGAATAALNTLTPDDELNSMRRNLAGATYQIRGEYDEQRLAGSLLIMALVLLVLDTLIALFLAGRLPRFGQVLGSASGIILMGGLASVIVTTSSDAQAPELGAAENALEVRLAYVITGDSRIDALSRAGLSGLSRESTRRSAVEPADPVGVNIERDAIVYFPVLYWPVSRDAPALSAAASAKVAAYLEAGGLILFDTRDGQGTALRQAPHPGLVRILADIDLPPLEPAPPDHVIGRSFYLLDEFPGRYPGGTVWVEAAGVGTSRDGVSGVVIGSADWAAAWAVDADGVPLAPVEGGARQRELAIRFGVNLAMYALTGNYKADQVHVPAILERLGQE